MKRYRFTKEDKKIILTHRDTSPEEIRDAYFSGLPVASVDLKLKRELDRLQFNNSTPWEEWEVNYLAANLNMRNREVQKTLFRPTVQINMMRWAIRHNRLPKKLARRAGAARVVEDNNNVPVTVVGTALGSMSQRVRQIANEGIRKAAETELQKALNHLGNVQKLLDVNVLVGIN